MLLGALFSSFCALWSLKVRDVIQVALVRRASWSVIGRSYAFSDLFAVLVLVLGGGLGVGAGFFVSILRYTRVDSLTVSIGNPAVIRWSPFVS